MSLLPRLNDSVAIDLEDGPNRVNASLSCDVVEVRKQPCWFPGGKPHNSTYYEFIYTYRVLKKPCLPFMSGKMRIPSHMITQILLALNCAAKILNTHNNNEETKALPLPASFDYEETNHLSNIDGYAATTGVRTRIVLRTGLPPEDKERGLKELLKKIQSTDEPAVFLWKANE
jgi:hypothetical protein